MRDRINQWVGLPYFNPTNVLREARRQGVRHQLGGRPTFPSDLHRSNRKPLLEDLDAAVFAHGIARMIPERDVCIAEFEVQDHDFVLRFGPPEEPGYCPLQLKVLVPEGVNPSQTSESLLSSLEKYADSADLVVAVKIDRPGVDPRALSVPSLRLAELWFFGPRPGSSVGWYLYGDCLGTPRWFEFELPDADPRAA